MKNLIYLTIIAVLAAVLVLSRYEVLEARRLLETSNTQAEVALKMVKKAKGEYVFGIKI